MSPRWKSMLGHRETDIGDRPQEWFDRVHPDDLPKVRVALESHLEGRTDDFASEHLLHHADGGYRWVLSRGMAVRRKVLGAAWVDRANARKTAFTEEFQDFITRCAWGEVWTRPHFD